MEAVLLEFLQRLEVAADKDGGYDEQIRVVLGEDIFYGFIKPNPHHQHSAAFGLSTDEGQALVMGALTHFLSAAYQVAQQFGLDTPQKRSEAVQNPNVSTASGRNYEYFFDCGEAEWWDNYQQNQNAG